MISIWEGCITNIWDAIQFCRIIDNLFFWAQHCLKPLVTKYLDQWRLRYCPDTPNIHSRLEKDTKTTAIVHRIQDRLSSLGISPNEDLPGLVKQAVILQELIGSTNDRKTSESKAEDDLEDFRNISMPYRPKEDLAEARPPDQEQMGEGNVENFDFKSMEEHQQSCDSSDNTNKTQSFRPSHFSVAQPESPPKYESIVFVATDEENKTSAKDDPTFAEGSQG
jgi:hypothetical protein